MRRWLLKFLIASFVLGAASRIEGSARSHASHVSRGKAVAQTRMNRRKREPSPGDFFGFQIDGRSERTAFELKIETGSRLTLPQCSGEDRFVKFDLSVPSTIEIELDAPPALTAPDFQLQPLSVSPRVTIPATPTVSTGASRTLYRLSYTLSPSRYLLKLGGGSTPATQRREEDCYLRVAQVEENVESLALSKGSRTTLRLDPISYSATRKIVIEKRTFVTFSVAGAPKPGEWERPVTVNIKNGASTPLEPVESSGREDERRYASFILTPNVYFVEVESEVFQWPHPLLAEPLRSAELSLQVDELMHQDLPESLLALQSWLTNVGLDKLMEVTEFFDLRHRQRGLPRSNQRLATFAAQVAGMRAPGDNTRFSERVDNLAQQIAAGQNIAWPAGLKKADRPLMVVSFLPKQGGDKFKASEEAFWEAHEVSLWSRVLQKISALEGISARRIVVYIPVYCSANLVYLHRNYSAERTGSGCASQTASISTSVPLAATANVASAATAPWYRLRFGSAPRTLENTVPGVLRLFLSPAPAELDFLTTEPDFVEVIVRGIRGQVIRGGRDWERLQLTIAVTGSGNQRMLRVTADGRLASGLGGYPSDSQFTRDMEPQYSMNLSEYTKRFARSLRNHLGN